MECNLNIFRNYFKQYTFILTASKELPKHCIRFGTTTAKYASRKNVGIRMPDDAVCQATLEKMYAPLIATRHVLIFCFYMSFFSSNKAWRLDVLSSRDM